MKLEEDKETQKIVKEFSDTVKIFRSRDYKKAMESFDKIGEQYKNSEFPSVLEIQRRAISYGDICRSKVNPPNYKPKSDEEYMNEIVFSLNMNDLTTSEKYFTHFTKKKFNSPYLDYLRSIYYIKKGEIDKSLEALGKCVKKDEEFKIRANNEQDFEQLFDNEKFNEIVE